MDRFDVTSRVGRRRSDALRSAIEFHRLNAQELGITPGECSDEIEITSTAVVFEAYLRDGKVVRDD